MKAEIKHQDAKLKYPKEGTYQISLHKKSDDYCKNIEVLTPEVLFVNTTDLIDKSTSTFHAIT